MRKIYTEACYLERSCITTVKSDKGIIDIHVTSDFIIDEYMRVPVLDSGYMWDRDGEVEDTKYLIPDMPYASMYQICIFI